MTNQTEPQLDVFDMSRTVSTPGSAPPVEDHDESEQTSRTARESKGPSTAISIDQVKKYAVPAGLVLALALGGVWTFAPSLISFGGSSNTAPGNATVQPTLAPSDAMRGAQQVPVPEAKPTAPISGVAGDPVPETVVSAPASTVVSKAEPAAQAPDTVASPPPVSGVEKELQGRLVTLEQSVVELQAKIALLEGRTPTAATTPASTTTAVKTAPAHNAAKVAQKKSASSSSSASKAVSKSANSVSLNKNFTLNTIYPGQAWIQDSEQVYVVQVGDHVGDMKILGLDPKGRSVMTTKGVIR
ncbi:hypothetical protein [Pseudomonas reactans]|uniref:hypothetical protein n=1 Tax=Pseudomonas reactans TaxID=117680 RepID=UPI0015A2C53E|nr:hypothetical protein [Pseudomonas reactans]NWC89968.1 hypothetical protein [Pseudomonas reactans]